MTTVKQIMTPNAKRCDANTDVATAAKIMWDADCGIVPVVDSDQKVIGVMTDRDICIALATRSTTSGNIRAREVMSREVHTCSENDDVREALRTLKQRRVRRLPVVDRQGRLSGIISLNDLVARAEFRKDADVPGDEFLETMKAISAHSPIPATA
jgi:CBS domain-containing protein